MVSCVGVIPTSVILVLSLVLFMQDRMMYDGDVCTYDEFTAYATLYASAGTCNSTGTALV